MILSREVYSPAGGDALPQAEAVRGHAGRRTSASLRTLMHGHTDKHSSETCVDTPVLARSFLTLRCQFGGCGHVSGLRWRRKAAGPDEVRGPGLNQIAADIAACLTARCPNPRLDRLASHCLVTLAKRLNSKAKTVRCFEFCDYAVAITGRTGARKFCPFTITAHEIRAVLLAIATVTNRAGRRLRRPLTQSAPAAVFRRA